MINNSLNLVNLRPGRKRKAELFSLSLSDESGGFLWISYNSKRMSVHKFTWLWLLSKWFLTSPDNIKRQQTIWGLTAQAADRRRLGNSRQATTWLSPSDHFAEVQSHLPTDVAFRTLMNQLVTPLRTAEEKQALRWAFTDALVQNSWITATLIL